jgi:hypothetical protein
MTFEARSLTHLAAQVAGPLPDVMVTVDYPGSFLHQARGRAIAFYVAPGEYGVRQLYVVFVVRAGGDHLDDRLADLPADRVRLDVDV